MSPMWSLFVPLSEGSILLRFARYRQMLQQFFTPIALGEDPRALFSQRKPHLAIFIRPPYCETALEGLARAFLPVQ